MKGCGGAEKFWSFVLKLPNAPPFLGTLAQIPTTHVADMFVACHEPANANAELIVDFN